MENTNSKTGDENNVAELHAYNEKRAEIYWWLSSLFSKELSLDDIKQYQSVEVRAFLSGLAESPELKRSTEKFIDALNRLQDREDAKMELAADYCQLFLGSDKSGALPYASIYVTKEKLLNGEPAQRMLNIMSKHGVATNKDFNEPADHIAIQLDFLGNLIIRSNELQQVAHIESAYKEQHDFVEQEMLNWIPQFSERCLTVDKFALYSAVAELAVNFCELDCSYLAKP